MQNLDIISVNIWQILVSLANLVLLFLMVKKFLYKPVVIMLEKRQNEIERDYSIAEEAKKTAMSDKTRYEEKLQSARLEADIIIKNAVNTADERKNEIIAEAKERAGGIVRNAESEAELQLKKAEEAIKEEIVEVSSLLAEKMLEREVSADDHKSFIDSFINSIGKEQ